MDTYSLQDRIRGSLIGGAVGDALGYAVEFSSFSNIRKKYGERGITDYELNSNGIAEFSDDTQMSLFTAEGLLDAIVHNKLDEDSILSGIRRGYEHWYATQTRVPYPIGNSWLSNVRSLWSERAPGMTCMEAMHQIAYGDGCPVENNSKGCGGVMRVAPIGMFSAAHPSILDFESCGVIAGKASYITHKHPLSTYSSMALAMIVSQCIIEDNIDCDKLRSIIINRVFKHLGQLFKKDDNLAKLFRIILKAMSLANMRYSDYDAIRELGQGWVAEETLAIAVFSVMRYIDDFEKCVCCAVNHDGDSDSTGAVAGNIVGAILGYEAITQKFKKNLELHDLLMSVAADLCGASTPEEMEARYVRHQPYNVDPQYLL